MGGIILLLLIALSPIDYMGHYYLFSAHMLQHVIILLVVPPLLVAGTDGMFLEKVMAHKVFRKTGNFLFHPLTAWILGVGSMWVWHIPSLVAAMKHSQMLMVLHMVSLLLIGIIFIWPVFTPIGFRKLTPLQSTLYLFTACVGCTTLGIFITFSPDGLYTSYLTGNDPAMLSLVRSQWGVTTAIDQQIGGLIMWVPACVIYVTNILITLGKWFTTRQGQDDLLHQGTIVK